MGQEQDPSKEQETNEEESVDSKINVAVRAQLKRELKPILEQLGALKSLDQTIAATVAKVIEAKEQSPDKAKAADKTDPQVKILQEQLEAIKKKQQETEEKARGLEAKARKESIRSQLRTSLEAKGVKGARANALISYLEQTSIREDDDGNAIFSVTRSRSKGAQAEPLDFDVSQGFEDWCKTAEAAEFFPAPNVAQRGTAQQPSARRTAPKYDAPPVSDAEAVRRTAEQLASRGVDLNSILDE